jgi:hypothetical protein
MVHAEGSRLQRFAQFICDAVDPRLRRCYRRWAGFGANADVDESAN